MRNFVKKVGFFITTEYLLNKEVEHVLAALTPENRLVVRTILHTGLRVSDVLSLKTEQLKPNFYVTESKTGKRRRVGLPADLLEDLKRVGRDTEYVFTNRCHSGHRTRQAVWADVKRAAKAFRFDQNIGTHSFRKAYAVELLNKYGDIERVRRALNHGSLTTTMVYAISDKLLEAKRGKKKMTR